jgi:hypothetical protein
MWFISALDSILNTILNTVLDYLIKIERAELLRLSNDIYGEDNE